MDYKHDPSSDDDFDYSNGFGDSFGAGAGHAAQGQMGNAHGLSKAELRKTNKPIMEKRRRARINHCLNELKSLILEAMKKDPARHTKLEKADILEMTVKHLQSVQRQQLNLAIQTDPTVIHKFKTGFVECAEEVNRYIGQLDGVDAMVRQRLTNHLNNCATNLEQLGSMSNFNNGYRGQLGMNIGVGVGMGVTAAPGALFGAALNPSTLGMSAANATAALFPPLPQDLNNNNNSGNGVLGASLVGGQQQPLPPVQMGGVQLIPSRLPSGEFALIMPSAHTKLLQNNNNNNNGVIGGNNSSGTAFTGWQQSISAAASASAAAISPAAAAAAAAVAGMTNPLVNSHAATPINDFTANYKRLSAFSKPPAAPAPTTVKTTILSGAANVIGNNCNNADFQQQQQQQQQPPTQTLQSRTTAVAAHQHLHHSSTATNSPPLSPISSISSHGDDSLMHTSSDFTASRPATPPLDATAPPQHSFSGVFSTPSSAETSLSSSTTSLTSAASNSAASLSTHLQQQQVSSTSGNGSSSGNGSVSSNNTSTISSGSGNNNNNSSANGSELNVSLKRSLDHDADSDVDVDDEADSSDAAEAPAKKKMVARVLPEDQSVLAKKKYKLQDLQEERDSMWRPW